MRRRLKGLTQQGRNSKRHRVCSGRLLAVDYTSAEATAVGLAQKRFGKKVDLGKVADGLDAVAEDIGAPGEGIEIFAGNEEKGKDGKTPDGYVRSNQRGRIYLNSQARGNDLNTEQTIAHEVGHHTFSYYPGTEYYAGSRGRGRGVGSLDQLVGAINANPKGGYAAYGVTDAYACAVEAYQGECQ